MEPLVSVVIPTYNSGKTIAKCLQSVFNQSYNKLETIIIDNFSQDSTREIASQYNAKVFLYKGKLLGARYLGFVKSKGEYIVLLDSDQILDSKTIERSVEMKDYDMLIFEEHTYKPDTWIQRLFEADRKLIHGLAGVHIDPVEGVLLARFYKRDLLGKVFKAIPKELIPFVIAHDHAIIYYEAYKISKKVGILRKAVWHIEPSNLIELWKKNYRYGKSTKKLIKSGYYLELLEKKVRFRKEAFSNVWLGLQSYLLLILKGIPYYIGYWKEGYASGSNG